MRMNVDEKIKDIMVSRITQDPDNPRKYWYDGKYSFMLLPDKTPLQSFFAGDPICATDRYDEIFDEVHPF